MKDIYSIEGYLDKFLPLFSFLEEIGFKRTEDEYFLYYEKEDINIKIFLGRYDESPCIVVYFKKNSNENVRFAIPNFMNLSPGDSIGLLPRSPDTELSEEQIYNYKLDRITCQALFLKNIARENKLNLKEFEQMNNKK